MPTSCGIPPQRFAETVDRLLRLKFVDDAEAFPALPGRMKQQSLEREVGDRLGTRLAAR
jgi:hypothetical protein